MKMEPGIPALVVNSLSLAFADRTNEFAIIIGVNAKSHSYRLTNVRNASLQSQNVCPRLTHT